MNRYVYHYHAQYQVDSYQMVNIDGILQLEDAITNYDDYMKLKPMISPEHHKKLIITNLSFLGMEQI